MFGRVGKPENLAPVVEAARFLRGELAATRGQKIVSVGFCMGGALSAALAANDPELAGAVVFYGMPPAEDAIAKIRCPVLGFYGGLDARIGAALPAFTEAMARAGKRLEKHVYEGAQHAFFNDTRAVYDASAARDAFARTLAFFREQLA